MTDKPAFNATFLHMLPASARGVAKVILEVPAEANAQVVEVLGGMMSPPGQSVWVTVVRMNPERQVVPDTGLHSEHHNELPAPSPERPARAQHLVDRVYNRTYSLPQRVCADPLFQQYLKQGYYIAEANEHLAAHAVRSYCDVKSRSEIIPGSEAGTKWDVLYGEFVTWRDAPDRPARAYLLAQRVGMTCAGIMFQRFLTDSYIISEPSEELAAAAVRQECGVKSRSEIIPGSEAAAKWDALYSKFLAWRHAPEMVP